MRDDLPQKTYYSIPLWAFLSGAIGFATVLFAIIALSLAYPAPTSVIQLP